MAEANKAFSHISDFNKIRIWQKDLTYTRNIGIMTHIDMEKLLLQRESYIMVVFLIKLERFMMVRLNNGLDGTRTRRGITITSAATTL